MSARVTRRALLGGLAGAAAGAALPAPVARAYDPASLAIKIGGIEIPGTAVSLSEPARAMADMGKRLAIGIADGISRWEEP